MKTESLFVALVSLSFGAFAQSLSVSIRPQQDFYWAGQRVSCILSLGLDGAVLHDGGNLQLSGLPENSAAVDFGSFSPGAGVTGVDFEWVAPLSLMAPTNFAISPKISGTLRREKSRKGSFFRQFSLEPFSVAAEPAVVEVRALPLDGRPSDFCGAVGPLSADVSLEPVRCSPGDIVTLRYSLSGPGAEMAMPLDWEAGEAFKTYPPRVEKREDGFFSAIQTVVPLSFASTSPVPFSVSWFDPERGWTRSAGGAFRLVLEERRPEPEEELTGNPDLEATVRPRSRSEETSSGSGVFTVASSLKARFAPGKTSPVLFEVPSGTPLEVIERSGRWLRVKIPSGYAGWIEDAAPKDGFSR